MHDATQNDTNMTTVTATGLSGDAFLKALSSEKVVLVVGVGQEQQNLSISEGILLDKAPYIAKQIQIWEKRDEHFGEKYVDMQEQGVSLVKIFVQWCYQERLPASDTTSIEGRESLTDQLKKRKQTLINLWIFAARHEITKLQNETMLSLISLLDKLTLFTLSDVRYIWTRTHRFKLSDELRVLACFAIVAKLQDPNDHSITYKDLDKLAGLEGFTSELYSATEEWMRFPGANGSSRKGSRSKWAKFCEKKEIAYLLMAEAEGGGEGDEEGTPPPPRSVPKTPAQNDVEVKKEPVTGIKREREEDMAFVPVKKEKREDEHEHELEVVQVEKVVRATETIDLTDD